MGMLWYSKVGKKGVSTCSLLKAMDGREKEESRFCANIEWRDNVRRGEKRRGCMQKRVWVRGKHLLAFLPLLGLCSHTSTFSSPSYDLKKKIYRKKKKAVSLVRAQGQRSCGESIYFQFWDCWLKQVCHNFRQGLFRTKDDCTCGSQQKPLSWFPFWTTCYLCFLKDQWKEKKKFF